MNKKKGITLLFAFCFLTLVSVGFTIAYIATNTDSITNTFTPAHVNVNVIETVTNSSTDVGIKENVKIQNSGDIAAYIRAAVVVTWQDVNGKIHAQKPTACTVSGCSHTDCGKDYAIQYGTNGWLKGGKFYYWTTPVSAGNSTGVLISSCKPIKTGPDGYSLSVEIFTSAIQAEGQNASEKLAVEDAWGVTVSGTTITSVSVKSN